MSVELSVTVWERTYRDVLSPGFIAHIAEMNLDSFTERVVVINNVADPADARDRAETLVAAGEIGGYVFVADHLDAALDRVRLSARSLEPVPHYTDHFLVKLAVGGAPYVCHWDSDARLVEAYDWTTPTVAYLERHREVLVGQTGWREQWSMDAERLTVDGDFDLGYGFSDHVWVARRDRLAQPIFGYVAPAAWWYPTSHLAPIFEQRVDAYMRRKRLLRAVYRPATYFHDDTMATPPGGSVPQRVRRKVQYAVRDAADRWWPTFNPTFVRRPRHPVPLRAGGAVELSEKQPD